MKLNNRGFGLIEVVMASGLMLIVGLGFMSLMQNANSGSRNIMQTTLANDERNLVSSVVADQATCTKNFGTSTMGNSTVVVSQTDTGPTFTNNIVNVAGGLVIPVNAPLPPQNALQIDKWSIIKWTINDSPTASPVMKGVATLRLYFSKIGTSVGAQNFVRDVPMVVNVDSATKTTVSACYSLGATEVFWKQGTTLSSIYYNGNVGIGTSSPNRPLEVIGRIRATSPGPVDTKAFIELLSNGGQLGMLGETNTGSMELWPNGSTNAMTLLASGQVGIGLTNPTAPLTVGGSGPNNYGGTPNIIANGDNHGGGGIEISDDGGFYDYNDGWITYNGSTGIKIGGNNGSGSTGNGLFVTGHVGVGTTPPTSAMMSIAVGNPNPQTGISIGSGNSQISLGLSDVGNGTWIRSGADTVLSTNTGSLYLGYAGNSGKTINIGNSAPGAFQVVGSAPANSVIIDGSGAMTVNGTVKATAFTYSSDERLKKKGPKLDGLLIIESLSGYHFSWKKDGREDVGVMAQEVEKVLPELVHETAEGQKSVDYARLVAPLIEAVKAQQREIKENQKQIESDHKLIEFLQSQISSLQSRSK